jgi:hypothetical protein
MYYTDTLKISRTGNEPVTDGSLCTALFVLTATVHRSNNWAIARRVHCTCEAVLIHQSQRTTTQHNTTQHNTTQHTQSNSCCVISQNSPRGTPSDWATRDLAYRQRFGEGLWRHRTEWQMETTTGGWLWRHPQKHTFTCKQQWPPAQTSSQSTISKWGRPATVSFPQICRLLKGSLTLCYYNWFLVNCGHYIYLVYHASLIYSHRVCSVSYGNSPYSCLPNY